MNFVNFEGKNILISGGAKGIGKETAILLSKLGAKVILVDLFPEELSNVLNILPGDKHSVYQYDLSDSDNIENLIDKIILDNGKLDGFVHCVGVRCRRPLSLLKPKVLNEILNVNFVSFVELTRCITKKANYNLGLSIVGISSISSIVGGKSVTAYASSKAAMDCAVRCLAKELSVKKIRLNTVVPSTINTHVFEEFNNNSNDSEFKDSILQRQYLGIGNPEDVANLIVFLLSSNSSFITGTSIPVDGGYLSS